MAMLLKVTLGPDQLSARPGQRTETEVTIQNTSQAVEHYATSVVGLPRDEYTDCQPALVKLRPGESGAVKVRINLPDKAGPDAGQYTLGVLVRSPYQREVSRCEELKLDVQPVPALSISVQPEVAQGGSAGSYAVRVGNDGNTPLTVTLDGRDPEGSVNFAFRPRVLQLDPGAVAEPALTARASAPWTGQEKRRMLTLRAAAGTDVTAEKPVTLVQKPKLAGGLLRTLGLGTGVAVIAAATVGGALLVRNGKQFLFPQPAANTTAPAATGAPTNQATGAGNASSAPPAKGSSAPVAGASGSAAPAGPTVADFTKMPDGSAVRDRIIPANFYPGVTLSTDIQQAPPECQDATGLALRTTQTFGSFLTSSGQAAANTCNTLPIRVTFAKPAKKVKVFFMGTGAQYIVTAELADGTTQPSAPAVTQPGKVMEMDLPANLTVKSILFSHASTDPASKDPIVLKKVSFVLSG